MKPGDVHPDSGNRLAPVDRAALDADEQKFYDEIAGDARTIAGLRGPAGISLHSPRLYARSRKANQYLRYECGLDPRLRELTILVVARETDAHFEWHAHEAVALREGLDPGIIDIVRHRKRVRGVGDQEAAIIQLGREALGRRRVRRSTFAKAFELFGSEMLVNITALMGSYASTAILLAVFGQQLPDGAKSRLD